MKWNLLLFLGVLVACNNAKDIEVISNDAETANKIVVTQYISEGYGEVERFIVNKVDTSSLSVVFAENTNKNIVANLYLDIYNKRYRDLYDSIAIEEYNMISTSSYYKMNSKEIMEELKLILEEFSNINKLKYINTELLYFGDFAIDITTLYTNKIGLIDYEIMEQILRESKIKTELDCILKSYSLEVKDIIVEKLFFVNKTNLYDLNKIDTDDSLVPDEILNCSIVFKIDSITSNIL
ncbi:hypothetical protein M2138_000968 [Dysgonomonadaceae bacterium PH5-43]|nr:hypothetical protein [Dysgonomonadaceae bacterium PH5-43]